MHPIKSGTVVSYSYRMHVLLGGAQVAGRGIVVGRTVVGTDDAYIVKPADGGDCVHVRAAGVRPA